VPEQAISRVSSYDWMVSLLIFPAGAAVAGPLADALGAATALTIFAFVSAVPLALVLLMPSVREVRRRDEPPAAEIAASEDEVVEQLPAAAAREVA
jgi:hypothetical protein